MGSALLQVPGPAVASQGSCSRVPTLFNLSALPLPIPGPTSVPPCGADCGRRLSPHNQHQRSLHEKLLGINERHQELVLHATSDGQFCKTATNNEDTTLARHRAKDAQDTAFPGCDHDLWNICGLLNSQDRGISLCVTTGKSTTFEELQLRHHEEDLGSCFFFLFFLFLLCPEEDEEGAMPRSTTATRPPPQPPRAASLGLAWHRAPASPSSSALKVSREEEGDGDGVQAVS